MMDDASPGALATTASRPVVSVDRRHLRVRPARMMRSRRRAAFLQAYPEIELEVVADDRFVNVLTEGFDAGIRYGERLEQDMVAIPIGQRVQRFAVGAAKAYLAEHGRPKHPRDLLSHVCFRGKFSGGLPLA